ncbi:HCaRG protein [Microvirga lotononidis]|uniref:HCaRG protein n=1 Tax=Microvirga lotononidis TaxID=864069 RepID=I4YPX0_9HYPH|nr:HCaRG protein [Microvirga lotononidis]EIM26012.1 HCaRG protein [Microvirga lotononidis]WQO25921.1 hypothetical protein U0023_14520 [Microvirga lotononidis]
MAFSSKIETQVSEIPAGALKAVRRGFAIASSLSPQQREQFYSDLFEALESGVSFVDLKVVAEAADLTRSQAADLVSAVSSVIGLISETEVTAEEFVEVARGRLFDEEQTDLVTALARAVTDRRSPLSSSLERNSLANETLPSLRAFDVTVDLRPRFAGDQIVDAVAVGLLHVDTDSEPEIWLQVSRGDIERMRNALDRAQKQMASAEELFRKDSSGAK